MDEDEIAELVLTAFLAVIAILLIITVVVSVLQAVLP